MPPKRRPVRFGCKGSDVLSFASYIRQIGHDILTCDGGLQERQSAIAVAIERRGRGATLDVYTAAVAAQIDLLPALKNWFGELYVPSSTITLFDRLLESERDK